MLLWWEVMCLKCIIVSYRVWQCLYLDVSACTDLRVEYRSFSLLSISGVFPYRLCTNSYCIHFFLAAAVYVFPQPARGYTQAVTQQCWQYKTGLFRGGGSHATLHLNKNASVQLSTLSTILTDFIRLNYTLCSDPDASAEHISSVAHIPDRSLIWVLGVKISAFSDPHVISIPWLFEGVLWLSLTDIVTILQVCVCVCCQRWCVSILSCTTYFTFSLLLVSVNVDGDDKQ